MHIDALWEREQGRKREDWTVHWGLHNRWNQSKLHAYCSSELGSIDPQHYPPARDWGGGFREVNKCLCAGTLLLLCPLCPGGLFWMPTARNRAGEWGGGLVLPEQSKSSSLLQWLLVMPAGELQISKPDSKFCISVCLFICPFLEKLQLSIKIKDYEIIRVVLHHRREMNNRALLWQLLFKKAALNTFWS